MNKYVHYLLVWVWVLPAMTQAQIISEVMMNPPSSDNGKEFIEIQAGASTSLSGYHLITIDGDGGQAGRVDQVIDLGSWSTGTNGLLLIRDAATVLDPAPDAATNVVVNDFSPDLENGSNTYLIVSGWSGSGSSDLDTDNDGTLDSQPWTSVLDGIGIIDGTPVNNHAYAAQLGFTDIPNMTSFVPDVIFRSSNNGNWYCADLVTAVPFSFDTNQTADSDGVLVNVSTTFDFATISPGGSNPLDLTAPLPVELLGFYLKGEGTVVNLNWATATEKDNAGWEIQRSEDGKIWANLDYVQGAGDSDNILEYTYEDRVPVTGISYYRLKQMDYDGTTTYTDVRAIERTDNSAKTPFSIFPNPATDALTLKSEPGIAIIVSLTGELVRTFEVVDLQTRVDVSDLLPGVYILQVQGKFGDWTTTRFVKKGLYDQ